ncbi:hypothetical protein [Actinokineospora sp.]|uniref:hypothetical protein n=1 Tax=Actinokineospora sp. TaxID=1872133 RepID=UPI004037FB16
MTVSHDAQWLATRVAPAAWVYIYEVQSCVADLDAAIADEDWMTCVESAAETINAILYCRLVLEGFTGRCTPEELTLYATVTDTPDTRRMRAVPPSITAGRHDALAAAESARQSAGELEADLPIHLPIIRTPQGFFPSVRVAGDIERLRENLGLPPIDWMSWRL